MCNSCCLLFSNLLIFESFHKEIHKIQRKRIKKKAITFLRSTKKWCFHLAAKIPDILIYDQSDVHPAAVKQRVLWKSHSVHTKKTPAGQCSDLINWPTHCCWVPAVCTFHTACQPKLGLSLLSRHFTSWTEWQISPQANH